VSLTVDTQAKRRQAVTPMGFDLPARRVFRGNCWEFAKKRGTSRRNPCGFMMLQCPWKSRATHVATMTYETTVKDEPEMPNSVCTTCASSWPRGSPCSPGSSWRRHASEFTAENTGDGAGVIWYRPQLYYYGKSKDGLASGCPQDGMRGQSAAVRPAGDYDQGVPVEPVPAVWNGPSTSRGTAGR
jgi:hypothetical protein